MNELLKTENEIADLLEATFEESKGLYKKEKTPRKLKTKLKKIQKILRLDNETQALIMAMLYQYRINEENLTNRAIAAHLDCELSDLAGIRHQVNMLFFGGYLVKIENMNIRCIELDKSLFLLHIIWRIRRLLQDVGNKRNTRILYTCKCHSKFNDPSF
jgi:hypothetical protein